MFYIYAAQAWMIDKLLYLVHTADKTRQDCLVLSCLVGVGGVN